VETPGYRGGRGQRVARSLLFRDAFRRWLDERGASVSWLSAQTQIARETLHYVLTEGRMLTRDNLMKVVSVLGVPQSEWQQFANGAKLFYPSDDPVWQLVRQKIQTGPFTDGTRRKFEEFILSAGEDVGRLSA